MVEQGSHRRYSDDEFAIILRKAAEMQDRNGAAHHSGGMSLAEMEGIAREAGIDPRFVAQAAASLARPLTAAGVSTRLLGGPRRFHLAETVSGTIPDGGWKALVEEIRRDFDRDDKVSHLPGSLEWSGKATSGVAVQVHVTSDSDGTRMDLAADAEDELVLWHLMLPVGGIMAAVATAVALDLSGLEALALAFGGAGGGYGAAWTIWRHRAALWQKRLGTLMERLTHTAAAVALSEPEAPHPPGGGAA